MLKTKRVNEIIYFKAEKADHESRKVIGDLLAERSMLYDVFEAARRCIENYSSSTCKCEDWRVPQHLREKLDLAVRKYNLNDNQRRETEQHELISTSGQKSAYLR